MPDTVYFRLDVLGVIRKTKFYTRQEIEIMLTDVELMTDGNAFRNNDKIHVKCSNGHESNVWCKRFIFGQTCENAVNKNVLVSWIGELIEIRGGAFAGSDGSHGVKGKCEISNSEIQLSTPSGERDCILEGKCDANSDGVDSITDRRIAIRMRLCR